MNRRFIDVTRRAIDASVVAGRVRPAVAGSVVCAGGAAVTRRVKAIGARIAAASSGARLRRESLDAPRRFDRMASESGLVLALSSVLAAPSIALREAGVVRLLQPYLDLHLSNRVRVIGCITLVAVITHTVLLPLLRGPVQGLGWGIRIALVAASVIAIRSPEPIAAAWSERFPKRGHVNPDTL